MKFDVFKKKWLIWLIVAYITGVGLRFLLGLLTSQNPFVMPDEALYANIARSIADGGGVALRNQPVTYTSLLYPLIISPAYGLFGAGSQFRVIQVINCLAMNLAVFPAYGIARRFSLNPKTAFGISVVALALPDMLLTTRIMTEAIEYPLFLLTMYLMFSRLTDDRPRLGFYALTAFSAFLLAQSKSGMVALAVVYLGILLYEWIRSRSRKGLYRVLVFAGTYAALAAAVYLILIGAGMDFSQPSIYDTQLQAPTFEHLKRTLPGLLLYAFFIPVAFGIYPLLLPACRLGQYEPQRRKMVLLTLIALALVAAGACYMFFDTETIGNYFQGRVHIRYVFMFLPVFLCFAVSKEIEGVKPNGKLLIALGFVLAMTLTVSFGALLSNRQYPVDTILLSYIIHDDASLDWTLFSQIAAITFLIGMLALLYFKGWGRKAKQVCAVCLLLGIAVSNWLGYDLNRYNDSPALAADARQAAGMVSGENLLIVPDSGLYFDNTLSVLDIALDEAPYFALYDDLCVSLGAYGALTDITPPQYWTEKPAHTISGISHVILSNTAFSRMVLADGVQAEWSQNGFYAVVTLPENHRLFHSALSGIGTDGTVGAASALYVYDEELLSQSSIRVYLKVSCTADAGLVLTANGTPYRYELDATREWIYADIPVPQECKVLKVSIQAEVGAPMILTYSLE